MMGVRGGLQFHSCGAVQHAAGQWPAHCLQARAAIARVAVLAHGTTVAGTDAGEPETPGGGPHCLVEPAMQTQTGAAHALAAARVGLERYCQPLARGSCAHAAT